MKSDETEVSINKAPINKKVAPIKKVFIEVNDAVNVHLDSKVLDYYGEILNSNHPDFYFQDRLMMPSNNLVSVGLPYRETSSASNVPYVEFYGFYKKNKLSISLNGRYKKQKEKYEYIYDIQTNKETLKVPVDLLVLRLNKKTMLLVTSCSLISTRKPGLSRLRVRCHPKCSQQSAKNSPLFGKKKWLWKNLKNSIVFHFV
ncbi:MAG: hypothetical protein LBQ98_03475 [Nitrososphaerota archaeon]|nr:hypothetical protein [Nitrososphaerota archaeon]